MPNLSDLQRMAPGELAVVSQDDLIAAILDGVIDTIVLDSVSEEGLGPTHRLEIQTLQLTGEALGAKEITWEYYETGEINTITIQDYSAQEAARLVASPPGKVPNHGQQPDIVIPTIPPTVIQHFTDGRQPQVVTD